jgi:hypothetical protein
MLGICRHCLTRGVHSFSVLRVAEGGGLLALPISGSVTYRHMFGHVVPDVSRAVRVAWGLRRVPARFSLCVHVYHVKRLLPLGRAILVEAFYPATYVRF